MTVETLAVECKFVAPTAAGSISGFAALFDGVPDRQGDTIAPGAFADSLTERKSRGDMPSMLVEHGGAPVGVWTSIIETDIGLSVEGQLDMSTESGKKALDSLKSGRMSGLSIGFKTIGSAPRPGGGRVLTRLALVEVSIVRNPAQERARVLSIKSVSPPAAYAASPPSPKGTIMEHTEQGEAAPDLAAIETKTAGMLAGIETKMTASLSGLTARLDKLETVSRRPGAAVMDTKAVSEVETKAFSTFIRHGRERLDPVEAKSLRVSDDTAGGYLAPEQFVTELLRNLVQFSPVRQVARVANTSASAVLLPKRTGGLTASWVGETGARPETTVTFGQNRYSVCELACYVDVSNTMLEDSAFDVASELSFEFAEEFGKAEGTAFVTGDGVVRPTGFMSDASLGYTASGSASAITADGLIDLFHALAPTYRANGVWMMNSTTLSAVRKLKDGIGNYLVLSAGLAGQVTTTLLGRPVVEAVDMPDVAGNAYPIAFGDFSQGYRIFDRVALSVLRDPYSQATNGMTRFHGRRRVAGGVAKAEAIRKLKIATS
ncbi:MAG: phage major capsid protein [Alphaproteobacteria bacterium]|nr:phage major capsid protein [Alphaproteobacteria bacterium]